MQLLLTLICTFLLELTSRLTFIATVMDYEVVLKLKTDLLECKEVSIDGEESAPSLVAEMETESLLASISSSSSS